MSQEVKNETLPDGTIVEFVTVEVKESNERWSELVLEDGSRFKFKVNIVSAERAIDKFDFNGNPIYRIKTSPTIVPENIPNELKKK